MAKLIDNSADTNFGREAGMDNKICSWIEINLAICPKKTGGRNQ